MPRNSDPSRIYHDPALTDRRGDATGPVALLFLVIVVAVFAGVAYGLVTYLPVAADPTPRPTPTAAPSARPTASPAPTATPAPASAAPASGPPDRTAEPVRSAAPATAEPLPSREPRATDARRPRTTGAIDETLAVFRNGKRIGTVRMSAFATGDVPGVDLPAGARFMVMEITYTSAAGMPYDAADWVAVGADGTRYPSLGDAAPDPVLGSGRLAAGETITGNVAFIRERRVGITQLILTDGDGTDLVAIERPTDP